jgi:hypothetical protein
MGRKPVFGLAGLFLASLSLTGCATDTDCWCPWNKTPSKNPTYDKPPVMKDGAVKANNQNPYGPTANNGMSDQKAAMPDRTAYGADPSIQPAGAKDMVMPDNSSMPKRPVMDTPREPVNDLGSKDTSSYGDPRNKVLPERNIPNDPLGSDPLPLEKPGVVERNKPSADPMLPLEEPPPVPGSNGKGPGLGSPTNEDLPPVGDSADSPPPAAPLPSRSKFQSNHQPIPAPPGAGDAPPVIPKKSAGNTDPDQ